MGHCCPPKLLKHLRCFRVVGVGKRQTSAPGAEEDVEFDIRAAQAEDAALGPVLNGLQMLAVQKNQLTQLNNIGKVRTKGLTTC